MIEVAVLNYLNSALSVPALMEVPENPPDRFVTIEKVGGGIRNHVRTASFAIQSYSLSSLYEAASLDEEVRSAMDVMADEVDEIGACRMASDYNFTDTRMKRYRYQCTYDITYMEV